jgi:hypothetical protein
VEHLGAVRVGAATEVQPLPQHWICNHEGSLT